MPSIKTIFKLSVVVIGVMFGAKFIPVIKDLV